MSFPVAFSVQLAQREQRRGEDSRNTIVIDLKHLAYDCSSSVFHDKKISQTTRNVNFLLAKNSTLLELWEFK